MIHDPDLVADTIRLPCSTIPRLSIGQPVAMAAGKDCSSVEHGNPVTVPTGRAKEPNTDAAHVEGLGIEMDRTLLLRLLSCILENPFTAFRDIRA